MSRTLQVYLHEQHCGELTQGSDGELAFAYRREYLDAAGPPVSVGMPLQQEPFTDIRTRAYFSGLLPDEQARQRLAAALGISRQNTFGLLDIIGGECAGALMLLSDNESLDVTDAGDDEALEPAALAHVLAQLRQRPLLAGEHGVRLSLAGAQDKLAVRLKGDTLVLPKGGRPTTHILKPFIEGLDGTVENEHFCMRLSKRVGLTTPEVLCGQVDDVRYLLIERYDRHEDKDGQIVRRHQEDCCQALGVLPEMKYEQEGGPGTNAIDALLQQHAMRPAADRLTFQRMLIFHYLVGNADAHAKNYALLHEQAQPQLAPVYDAVCTAAYPALSQHMAMAVGGRALPDTVKRKHWESLVPDTKAGKRLIARELLAMANQVEQALEPVLREVREQGAYHPVLKRVMKIIRTRIGLVRSAVDG